MFQSLGRGWIFLKQSWLFGQRSPIVLFPTLVGLLVSVFTIFVMLFPVASLILYIRKNELGQLAIGLVLGLLLIVLVAVINVLTIMTSYLVGVVLTGKTPVTVDAWKKLADLGADLYLMGLGLPIQRFWIAIRRLFKIGSAGSSWDDDDHLLMPILANEVVTLRQVPERIAKMQADNCVFSAQGVGIRKLGFLLSAGALLVGLGAGLGVAWLVLTQGYDAGQSRVLAFGLAVLLVTVFGLPIILINAYAITLFNTCLYRWGVSVRDARGQGASGEVIVPEPLAVAMGIHSGR